MLNVLFVCTENRLRSPTAQGVFMRDPELFVRSGGISETAVKRVTQEDLKWADLVVVMEPWQRRFIKKNFPVYAKTTRMICLDIPDIYDYMAPELIAELKKKLIPIFGTMT